MKLTSETKAQFRALFGRPPHHKWGEQKVLDEIAKKGDSDEEKEEPPPNEKKEKKDLKPVHSSLFIPKFGDTPARLVQRDNWNEQDTKDYREAYKDRQKKAMKKLK